MTKKKNKRYVPQKGDILLYTSTPHYSWDRKVKEIVYVVWPSNCDSSYIRVIPIRSLAAISSNTNYFSVKQGQLTKLNKNKRQCIWDLVLRIKIGQLQEKQSFYHTKGHKLSAWKRAHLQLCKAKRELRRIKP